MGGREVLGGNTDFLCWIAGSFFLARLDWEEEGTAENAAETV